MKVENSQQHVLWLGVSILALLTLSPALLGQVSSETSPGSSPDLQADGPVITDWSSRHVVFSKPATAQQAERVKKDFRYWQQLRRQSTARLSDAANENALDREFQLAAAAAHLLGNQKIGGDWSEDLGSGATIGATNYPAKYGFQATTANCGSATQPDFVVYATGLTGSATQASIVAFDNLYSGCSGTVPSIYWAYNTFDGTITTSPVISKDGKQIAFVQTTSGGNAELVLLKWLASTSETIGAPLSLTRVRNSEYPTCNAPCMTTALLKNAGGTQLDADTNSSVFYDYSDDTAYVGDASGYLHQFNPVFGGEPAEVLSAGWPVLLNPTTPTALTSAVYDYNSGRVFVADVGGYAYRVGPNTAFVTASSGPLDYSSAEGGAGIVQGPIVDATAEVVYVFASSDGSGGCLGGADCTAVYELLVDFPENDTGSEAIVGSSTISGTAPNPLYLGTFDSTYENSTNGSGNLYVCGNTGGPPILYQIHLTAGAFGAVDAGPVISTSSSTPCSPVTDIANPNAAAGPTEWIFASTENGGAASGCSSGGCIFNFVDTPWLASTAYTVGQQILDTHFQIQVVTKAGTSGASAPSWQTIPGKTATDGTVTWIDQGFQSAFTPAAWVKNNVYNKGSKILDGNNNIQLVTKAGTSGATTPSFNATAGLTTSDGSVTWTNVGAIATASLAVDGGTSGIIIDNTVGSGTLAGASQAYFSTLGSETCGTSGTGGCAVQASQAGLQ
ncbi:MAG: hypothetical protein ACLQLC_15255 [Candidatus Sulfotelmatobacter sp.]